MTQSRNAIGNLIARYNSVLTRCNILNSEIMKKIASTTVSTCFIFLGCLSGADAWAADLTVTSGDTVNIQTSTQYDKIIIKKNGTLEMIDWCEPKATTLINSGALIGNTYWGNIYTETYTNDNGTLTGDVNIYVDNFTNKSGIFKTNNFNGNIREKTPLASNRTLTNNATFIHNDWSTINFDTVINNINKVNVSQWGDPIETGTESLTLDNGILDVGTVNNTKGLIDINGGTLLADTINNSTAVNVDKTTQTATGSYIKVDGGTLGSDKTTVNNSGFILVGGGNVNAKEWKNETSATTKLNGGTANITTLNNAATFYVNSGNVKLTATKLNNTAGFFEINAGDVNITSIENEGSGKFIMNNGTLQTDIINNTSIFALSGGKTTGLTAPSVTTINNGTYATSQLTTGKDDRQFLVNNGALQATTFVNYETFKINNNWYDTNSDNIVDTRGASHVTIDTLTTHAGSYVGINGNQVYGFDTPATSDDIGQSTTLDLATAQANVTVKNAFINNGEFHTNSGGYAVFGNTFANNTVLDIHGTPWRGYAGSGTPNDGAYANTVVAVNDNFTNGNSSSTGAGNGDGTTGNTEYSSNIDITSGGKLYVDGVFYNDRGSLKIANLGSVLEVTGDYISGSYGESFFHIASGYKDIPPSSYNPAANNPKDKETAAIIGGNFYNKEGTVEVHNADTSLTVNGDKGFYNGTDSTQGTVHTMTGATLKVSKGDFTNTNGVVGVHGGTIDVFGTFINNRDVEVPRDADHTGVSETVHILDGGLLKANTLAHNVGDMGIYNKGKAKFTTANSKKDTVINVHGGGTFTANKGALDGTFTVAQSETITKNNPPIITDKGKFIKSGLATDILSMSNKIVNKGTITVNNGGLVLEGLADAGSIAHPTTTAKQDVYKNYAGHFVTEGDVIVNGKNAYLKLDGDIDKGKLDIEALKSLITEGYATSNSQLDSVTMQQASVLFYDGVGIVLAGNDAKLIVSNTAPVTSSNSVHFGDGTLFKFNGHDYDRTNATITIDGAAGSIDISSTSKFFATNLIANKFYTIIENVDASAKTELANSGWAKSINGQDSLHRMIKDVRIEYVANGTHPNGTTDNQYKSSTNDIVLAAGGINDENFGVDEGIFESMKDLWEKEKNDKGGDNAGNGFVSDAASETVIPDDKEAGKTLESATNAAISGGVVHLTTDASNIMSQAVNVRMDGLHADSGGYTEDISATDWGIWAIPLYQQSQVRNIDIGKTTGGYDGWLAGVVAGIDRKKDEWTLGVALGIGIGEMESTDNFVDTDTDMDFWSAIAYAAYHKNRFEWKADFTYTNAASEITQANPYNLIAVAPIRADVDGQIFSIGTQISYKIIDDDVDVTPHIGLRYRAYRQDGYTTNIDGRELFDVKYADMDTLLLPVGVLLSTDFIWNEWLLTPRMDLTYTAFFGDTAINNYFGFAGSGDDVDAFGTVEMQSDILDDHMLSLSVGCGAKKDKWSFGLDFDFQRSENREAQAVFARVAYRW